MLLKLKTITCTYINLKNLLKSVFHAIQNQIDFTSRQIRDIPKFLTDRMSVDVSFVIEPSEPLKSMVKSMVRYTLLLVQVK